MSKESDKEATASLAFMSDPSCNSINNTVAGNLKVILVVSTALMLTATVKDRPNLGMSPYVQEMASVNYPYMNLEPGLSRSNEKRPEGVSQISISAMPQKGEVVGTSGELADAQKEVEILKNRLSNCLPVHTLTYIFLSTIGVSISLTLLYIRYALKIYIIDPYYLFCALIISTTLLLTAVVSLKSWRDFLENIVHEKLDQ